MVTAHRNVSFLKVRVAEHLELVRGLAVTKNPLSPAELHRQGFDALVAGLGWVNAVCFIQQYEQSNYDYTKERVDILPDWDAKTLVANWRRRRPT
jgi:hypothetical protein